MGRLSAAGAAALLLLAAVGCGGDGNGKGKPGARGRAADAGAADSTVTGLEIGDAEFRAFVRASAELEALRRQMLTGIQEARDAEERRRLRRRYRAARDSLLRKSGLGGARRYDEIRNAIEADESLRERWRKLRGRIRAASPPR